MQVLLVLLETGPTARQRGVGGGETNREVDGQIDVGLMLLVESFPSCLTAGFALWVFVEV